MRLPRLFRLPGNRIQVVSLPPECPACGCKQVFKQADFNRTVGLYLLGVASLLTVYLAVKQYNWFLIWAPLPAFLILDRVLDRYVDRAVLCYLCESVFEGLSPEALKSIDEFDLDTKDRLLYPTRTAKE